MKPYGCNNSARAPGYYTPQRVFHADRSFVVMAVWVDDVTSRPCQYRKETPNDPRCAGCLK